MTEQDYLPPETDGESEESAASARDREFDRQTKKDFLSSARNPNHVWWRKKARQWFEFVPGGDGDDSGQWDKADIATLKEQNRPIITMNRLEPLVEGIVGAEVNNRQNVNFEAREEGDKAVAQTLLEVALWARDNDVEEEETDAFENTLICGMGWTRHQMDYESDMDGRYEVISTDPLGHYWDVDARRPNLADARWVGYVEVMSRDKFKAMFPGKTGKDNIFGIKSSHRDDSDRAAKDDTDYDDPNLMGEEGTDRTPDEVHVLEFQCYRLEPAFRVLDPMAGKLSAPLEQKEFNKLRDAAEKSGAVMARFGTPVDPPEPGEEPPPVFRFLKQERRIYYRAFYTGNERLEPPERNPWRNGFSMLCITGRRHRTKNIWYGVVSAMVDPQRFTNAFMSSAVHHYNSNPKGGVFYETDAVENAEELKAMLAHPSPAIELNSGGLQRILPIQPAAPSQALDRLIQIVSDMPPLVTGVSLEWLGLAGRDQAVGLEQTRKLATLSIVAPIFSSYRKYKKTAGRLLFDYVKDYIPESTLERVVREPNRQYVPLLKQADTMKYDVHVDDAPLSPSIKATVFSLMKDFAQFMFDKLPPASAMAASRAFFKFSPLPTDLVNELTQAMLPPPPDKMQQMAKVGELRKLFAEGDRLSADADLKKAKAVTEGEKPDHDSEKMEQELFDSLLNFMQVRLQQKSDGKSQDNGAK